MLEDPDDLTTMMTSQEVLDRATRAKEVQEPKTEPDPGPEPSSVLEPTESTPMSSPGGQNNSDNLPKPGLVRHLAEYFDRIGKGTPTKLPNLTKTKGGSITKKKS